MDRRSFLKSSGMMALVPMLGASSPKRILVMLHMQGGNDGLNTVVPLGNADYAKYRPTVRIAENKAIKLTSEIGLHPNMQAMADLYHEGNLSIIRGVGYANTSRSHYRSMAIWDSAQNEPYGFDTSGWLGRALYDSSHPSNTVPAIYVGKEPSPVAFKGCDSLSIPQEDIDREITLGMSRYPDSEIGTRLRAIAKLIKGGSPAKAYYTRHEGYDTHVGQLPIHANLLGEFSEAVACFTRDMNDSGYGHNVTLVGFSEFGRQLRENISSGTDHGTAGPVFVAGQSVIGGVIGKAPTTDHKQGQLIHSNDFRSVYATLLQNWLKLDPMNTLAHNYKTIQLFGEKQLA